MTPWPLWHMDVHGWLGPWQRVNGQWRRRAGIYHAERIVQNRPEFDVIEKHDGFGNTLAAYVILVAA